MRRVEVFFPCLFLFYFSLAGEVVSRRVLEHWWYSNTGKVTCLGGKVVDTKRVVFGSSKREDWKCHVRHHGIERTGLGWHTVLNYTSLADEPRKASE